MKYSLICRIMSLLRVALFVLAVSGIAVSILWLSGKPLVNNFERVLISSYKSYYKARLDECRSILSKDSLEGIKSLEEFIRDIKEIKKKDRLDPQKRQAFELLISALLQRGDNEQALKWVEEWIEFDERDLYAIVQRANIMLGIPRLSEEGFNSLETLYKKIPEVRLVSENYAEVLLRREQYADAFIVIENSINSSDMFFRRGWDVFWDTGRSFNAGQRSSIIPSKTLTDELSLVFHLQPKAKRIRIDPPPSIALVINEPRAMRVVPSAKNELRITEMVLRTHQVTQDGNKLKTSGGNDPYFYWDVPESLISEKKSTWVFAASVEEAYPRFFTRLLEPRNAELVRAKLASSGDKLSLKKFNLMIEKQSKRLVASSSEAVGSPKTAGHFELFWKHDQESFSQVRKKRVDLNGKDSIFSYQFMLGAKVSQLRLDLPESLGMKYFLESIEIVSDGVSFNLDLEKMTPKNLHNVEKKGRTFLVIAKDPYFSFEIPKKLEHVTAVKIKGVVR